jgi:RNA polymerase sigma factor (TIGR02999 family)
VAKRGVGGEPAPALPVTELLQAWGRGEPGAIDRLVPAVYLELRRRAAVQLRREGAGHTLQPTALVHEVFLRLFDQTRVRFEGRAHFLAVCSGIMRRVLIDHARRRLRAKRGGTLLRVELDFEPEAEAARELDLVALDRALDELMALDPEQARLVEMRFFGGLTTEEAALALGVSSRTVKRDWRSAKAWLLHRLSEGTPAA